MLNIYKEKKDDISKNQMEVVGYHSVVSAYIVVYG